MQVDIWGVAITAIELAQLAPPFADTKSVFKVRVTVRVTVRVRVTVTVGVGVRVRVRVRVGLGLANPNRTLTLTKVMMLIVNGEPATLEPSTVASPAFHDFLRVALIKVTLRLRLRLRVP